jgi:hypothetical protein
MRFMMSGMALAVVAGVVPEVDALGNAGGNGEEAAVKEELGPRWSRQQRAAGERFRKAWEEFAGGARSAQATQAPPFPGGSAAAEVAEVRARHEAELMRHPHGVGVSEGICSKGGRRTEEPCVLVLVERKVSAKELAKDAVLPKRIEGVGVDVVEAGGIEVLPR